jgi:hypothetical protein
MDSAISQPVLLTQQGVGYVGTSERGAESACREPFVSRQREVE